MRLEDMKKDIPETPEFIHNDRSKAKVKKQLRTRRWLIFRQGE